MRLMRDLLDKQLVDREQRKMGKVDGITLEVRDGEPPRLAYVEIGAATLAWRLAPWLGRWTERLLGRAGPEFAGPTRIPIEKLRDLGVDVEMDVDAERIGAMRWEDWLRERVVEKIPGAER
jgi:hypothetical protein